MKAREKFNARMMELGMTPESDDVNEMSVEARLSDGRVIGMVIYPQADNSAEFVEFRTPLLKDLRSNALFIEGMCCRLSDGGFIKEVGLFIDWVRGYKDECPVPELDIYWVCYTKLLDQIEKIVFTDDPEQGLGDNGPFGSIMDDSNGHDTALVAQINACYNTYGAAKFMVAICTLYSDAPFAELETITWKDIERISMSHIVSEILENWCSNDELNDIICMVKGTSTRLEDFYNKDGKLVAQLFHY